jgi:thioredoxin 1
MQSASNVTDDNFRDILGQASGVVMFIKKLCPNCKAMEKMLAKFFDANPGIQYISVDSEECPEAMKANDVQRVPTILVLKNGTITGRKVGLMNVREMTAFYLSA